VEAVTTDAQNLVHGKETEVNALRAAWNTAKNHLRAMDKSAKTSASKLLQAASDRHATVTTNAGKAVADGFAGSIAPTHAWTSFAADKGPVEKQAAEVWVDMMMGCPETECALRTLSLELQSAENALAIALATPNQKVNEARIRLAAAERELAAADRKLAETSAATMEAVVEMARTVKDGTEGERLLKLQELADKQQLCLTATDRATRAQAKLALAKQAATDAKLKALANTEEELTWHVRKATAVAQVAARAQQVSAAATRAAAIARQKAARARQYYDATKQALSQMVATKPAAAQAVVEVLIQSSSKWSSQLAVQRAVDCGEPPEAWKFLEDDVARAAKYSEMLIDALGYVQEATPYVVRGKGYIERDGKLTRRQLLAV